jgi:hypothetical protein
MCLVVSCSFDLKVRQKKQCGDVLRTRSKKYGLNYLVTANYFLSQKSDQGDLYVYVKLNMYVEINLTFSHYRRVYKV